MSTTEPAFLPDSMLVRALAPSPNFGARRAAVDMLVLHYTGMASGEAAVALLADPASQVSAHYVVSEDGTILQMVAEAARAWHAGVSSWEGLTDINSRSIGIEIVNGGHDFGLPGFPDAQIEAVIALGRDIVARYAIRADRVVAHSDIAPARKRDPGEAFPWTRLNAAGLGHWVPEARADSIGRSLGPGDSGPDVATLQALLAFYGYGLPQAGLFDATTGEVVRAFQRHFRPSRIDGIADPATILTLRDLIATRPRANPSMG